MGWYWLVIFDNQLKNRTHAVSDSGHFTYWLGTWFFCVWGRAIDTYFACGRNYSDLAAAHQGRNPGLI
jgi:hypothetical protein